MVSCRSKRGEGDATRDQAERRSAGMQFPRCVRKPVNTKLKMVQCFLLRTLSSKWISSAGMNDDCIISRWSPLEEGVSPAPP
jgi:hypothetical protein